MEEQLVNIGPSNNSLVFASKMQATKATAGWKPSAQQKEHLVKWMAVSRPGANVCSGVNLLNLQELSELNDKMIF